MKRLALESDYSSPYFTPLHTANKKARLMTSRTRTRTRDTPEYDCPLLFPIFLPINRNYN